MEKYVWRLLDDHEHDLNDRFVEEMRIDGGRLIKTSDRYKNCGPEGQSTDWKVCLVFIPDSDKQKQLKVLK